MTRYHSDEYIRFLRNIRPDNVSEHTKFMQRCEFTFLVFMLFCYCLNMHCTVNVGEDCPVFDGMYEFCQLSAGGSIGKFPLISCTTSLCWYCTLLVFMLALLVIIQHLMRVPWHACAGSLWKHIMGEYDNV